MQLHKELFDALFGYTVVEPDIGRQHASGVCLGGKACQLAPGIACELVEDAFHLALLVEEPEDVFAVGVVQRCVDLLAAWRRVYSLNC